MTTPMLQHIPLKFAYLCQDCDSIGNCATSCPACASQSLMGLSAILDREVVQERRPVTQMPIAAYPQYTALVA
jgi:ferredoxin